MNFEVKTPNFSFDRISAFNGKTVAVEKWNGPTNPDGSFSFSCKFRVSSNARRHCMIASSRSNVHFGGWNVQKVGNQISLQIGNGKKWFGARFEGNDGIIENGKWYNVAFSINKKDSNVKFYLDDKETTLILPGNYRHATNTIYIGGLNQAESNFMFSGDIKDIKLGNDLNEKSDNENVDSFDDEPIDIKEFDINNFINILDQYTDDREWINSALDRLRLELREEMDLNTKLNKLDESDNAFLVSKVEKFMNDYAKEIKDTETELSDIYKKLQTFISDNFKLLNSNKQLKDKMMKFNNNGIDTSILNIRKLINDNVLLLKNNDRWGDSTDVAFKFSAY